MGQPWIRSIKGTENGSWAKYVVLRCSSFPRIYAMNPVEQALGRDILFDETDPDRARARVSESKDSCCNSRDIWASRAVLDGTGVEEGEVGLDWCDGVDVDVGVGERRRAWERVRRRVARDSRSERRRARPITQKPQKLR